MRDQFSTGPFQDVPIIYGSKVEPGERIEVMPVEEHEAVLAAEREKREAAEARYREIASKLESGYGFCHPESDCEGLRAATRAEALLERAAAEFERRAAADSPVVTTDRQGWADAAAFLRNLKSDQTTPLAQTEEATTKQGERLSAQFEEGGEDQ